MPIPVLSRIRTGLRLLLVVVGISGLLICQPLWAQSKTKGAKGKTSKNSGTKSKRAREAAQGGVGEYQSDNFAILTDLPPDDAKELLKRLETMLVQVEKYYEHKLRAPIGMYVVKDLKAWPADVLAQFNPNGLSSIRDGGGLTLGKSRVSLSTGEVVDSAATVYAVSDRGTPQHEAVHAYCQLTFGRLGPIWYAEGMAEIGQYWTEKHKGVYCHDMVLEYLQKSKPKELIEIVDLSDRSGDSWENYAWRWVLCHMLANNPNYAPRFKPLGLGMLNGKDVSFESVYGSMAEEIQFEYSFFLKHIEQGYRADLCAWDWSSKFAACKGLLPITTKIDAMRGWQASKAIVIADEEYDYSASGLWKISADGIPLDADGEADASGKLVGAIFDDYKLSEPFELGAYGKFTPPMSGKLVVRCQDKWNELGDNSGKIQLKVRQSGKVNPLPRPDKKPIEPSSGSKTSKTKASVGR
jgi:hypothetical protein